MHGRDENGCHIMFIGASDEKQARCEIAHGLSESGEASFPPEIRDLKPVRVRLRYHLIRAGVSNYQVFACNQRDKEIHEKATNEDHCYGYLRGEDWMRSVKAWLPLKRHRRYRMEMGSDTM